jgi:Nucleotidyl transferase AbiEii toxin, Type IV TA system
MDSSYTQTVRLLLAGAHDVFANTIFAMKGGTAINPSVRDMPRLSVDIDVVYVLWQTPREQALQESNRSLSETGSRLRAELRQRLTSNQRAFLVGLTNAKPDWSLLQCAYAENLPALRWKLSNLETFRQRRPAEFARQVEELEKRLN